MRNPRVGFVACVHPLYEVPAAVEPRQAAIRALEAAGCEVMAAETTPKTPLEARAAAASLRERDVDLVLLFFCTWVAEDVTLTLARELMDTPMLIWALPFLERTVPMPSPISGLVASASNIRRMGKRFAHMVGAVNPESVGNAVAAARAAAAARSLARARFGLIGGACPGMLDVGVDPTELQQALGATAVSLDLDTLLKASETAPPAEAAQAAERLRATGQCAIGPERLLESLRLYSGLKQLAQRHALDGYAVRCWPELRDQRGITPCAAHSLLAEEGLANTCEIDLTALATTYLLSQLAAAPAFNFDITGFFEDEDAVQFAHCGAAARTLAASPEQVALRSHMRTGTGATVEFPFKTGPATLAKLLRPREGRWRLFAAAADVIPTEAGTRGSVALVRPRPSAQAFLDAMMREAVEHHVALVYGNWLRELEMFCQFSGVEYILPPA
jgi:L-fucose isomerase-like protein